MAPAISTAPSPLPAAPQTIGSYRVLGALGEGGMGHAHLAEHTVLGRRVAIEVLGDEAARDREAVARAFAVARAASELRHPSIQEVVDTGDHLGRPFIVTEHLEGETLARRLARRGALPEETAARIARQVASALGAAHARGIVHRGLEPARIFLCDHAAAPGAVKILGFGMAELAGVVAPDARGDLYALGALLREMLTHAPEVPVDPAPVAPQLSPRMKALVTRAMATRPPDRFADMRELAAALDAIASPPPPPAGAADVPQALGALVRGRIRAGAPEIPPLPPLVAAVMRIAARPGLSFTATQDILRREPSLAALVVRIANAEPYESDLPASSLEQAIARIGAPGLRIALLELAARPMIESRNARVDALFRRPWQRALAGAFIARRLVELAVPEADPSHAHQAALLRDVGRPLVASLVADTDRRTRGGAAGQPRGDSSWLACVEANHVAVRVRLAEAWRQPPPVIQALADDGTGAPAPLAAAIRLAAALADLEGFFLDQDDVTRAEAALAPACAALGVDEALTRRAVQRVKEWVLIRG
jgi:serine/threonine protein kinase